MINSVKRMIGMNENLIIKKMTADDIDIVYAVHLNNLGNDPEGHIINWLNETINDPYGYFFVAYWGGELVGYCGM